MFWSKSKLVFLFKYFGLFLLLSGSIGGQSRKTNAHTDSSITVVSWNTQKMGRSKSRNTINLMAKVLRNYDMVALQEVVAKDPAGAQKVGELADALNRMGAKWDYQVSDPTHSSSVYTRERYAFLWKTSKVQMIHRAYLDRELQKVIDREPFVGRFKIKRSGKEFYLVTFHARPIRQQPEMEAIYLKAYPQRLKTQRVIITGDFNLSERNPVWNSFYEIGFKNALKNDATTLKRKCQSGKYLQNPFDNFYYGTEVQKHKAGVVDYIGHCRNLENGRLLSDHLPVYFTFTVK